MSETTLLLDHKVQQPAAMDGQMRRRRLLALGLVLSVSFARFIVAAFYYLFEGTSQVQSNQQSIRLLGALVAEITSLLLLWFVLSGQSRNWKDVGWNPKWTDIFHGVGLIVAAGAVARAATLCFQLSYRSGSGHYLQPRSVHGLLGGGVSVLAIVFVLINPLFEEVIVRGYTMSEVIALGGSQTQAILVSVCIQMSYHVYQGLLRCIGLTAAFVVLSIYFSKTRRIVPVVIAHWWSDASALIRLSR